MNDLSNSGGDHDVFSLAACAGSAAAVTIGGDFTDGDARMPELPRSPADDERIALHEGSHAFVGRLLGSPLGGVTIVAGDGFAGRCWGPEFESKFANGDDSTPSICARICALMPGPGEAREEASEIYAHVFVRVTELVAGTEGERLFCKAEPWYAVDDERQALALAPLITSSP